MTNVCIRYQVLCHIDKSIISDKGKLFKMSFGILYSFTIRQLRVLVTQLCGNILRHLIQFGDIR